jgi:long-chain acyl-CoA synthetase
VREITVPAIVARDPGANLTDLVVRNARDAPHTAQFSRPVDGRWQDVTCEQFHTEAVRLAAGLVAAGVAAGDRVAIMSKTRYEWTLADFAIWFAGGVSVPIYETSSEEQVSWILSDSGAVAVFAETARHESMIARARDRLPALRQVWVFDAGAVDELGTAGGAVDGEQLEHRRRALVASCVATIIYTSGTTGRPKGCELTHANFAELAANATADLSAVVAADGASTLLFLPLAHVFARFVQVLCVCSRARMGHSSDAKNLVDDLGAFRPTFVLAVPRVFEKIYNSAEATATAGGRARIFHAAVDTAVAWSRALDSGGPGVALRLRHALFDRLVYQRLRDRLGGRITYAVSGGAPLGTRLGHFFRGIGVTILEGWGLTETTAPATVNTPVNLRIGTVGRPLPGVGVRVADDGELMVSGLGVLRGYFGNPAATAEAIEDGWFRSGDLGTIDDQGFVRITGRKKEIIVTAGGKNVAPAVLEDRLRAHSLISQCVVVGDQRPFIGALVTLDAEMLPAWLSHRGKPALEVAAAATDPDVLAEVQLAVDHANEAVSTAESIRRFRVLDVDFTEAGGQLTPKLSLKRAVVLAQFADQVEALYR